MKETEHYHLKKPEDTDFVRVSDLNSNADAIDAKLHELATEVTPIARGGTGATDAATARANLEAASQTDLDTLRDSVSLKTLQITRTTTASGIIGTGLKISDAVVYAVRPSVAYRCIPYVGTDGSWNAIVLKAQAVQEAVANVSVDITVYYV